ncbi:amino acid ABC transporter permease [Spongorhabdus nitratireducens]
MAGFKPVNPPKQMERQPNKVLWNLVFGLILFVVGLGLYKSSQSIDYSWRWERLPEYILYKSDNVVRAQFDGTVSITADNTVILTDDFDANNIQQVTEFQSSLVYDGDLVFEGDPLTSTVAWKAGPLLDGLVMTLKLSMVALVFALLLGSLTGLARVSPNPALKNLAIVYIELVRGTPLLVQIFIIYFFIGTVLNLDRFTAGATALAVFTGAYIAEIIRAGIESINKGQMEAARSLGMDYNASMRYIILPQAFKRVLPPLAGQFINLIKDSSLVSVIAITDLTKAGREVISVTFSPFEVWFTVALMYLVLTGLLSFLVTRLEKKYALHG